MISYNYIQYILQILFGLAPFNCIRFHVPDIQKCILLTAKNNTRDVLPMCQDKFDHLDNIYHFQSNVMQFNFFPRAVSSKFIFQVFHEYLKH